MRKTNLYGATFLALATAATPLTAFAQAPAASPAPAEAAPAAAAPDAAAPTAAAPAPAKKHMTHKPMKHMGKLAPTKAGDKAVEDLNDASLSAAKSGTAFKAPMTPEAAKKEAHAPMHKKAMHHMAKTKAAAKAPADAAAPPADASGK